MKTHNKDEEGCSFSLNQTKQYFEILYIADNIIEKDLMNGPLVVVSRLSRTAQNLQQNPQPLFPWQQLQHKVHKEMWLLRFCLMWVGAWVREGGGGGVQLKTHSCVYPLLVRWEHRETPRGKHIHLKFNLLMVIGLIHAVNWTYHPRVHWHFWMRHNWSVTALCLLQLLHLLMNYAHLGAILTKHLQLISKWSEFKLKSYPGEWAGRAPQNANKGEHECHCNCNAECLHFRERSWCAVVVESFQWLRPMALFSHGCQTSAGRWPPG